MSLVSLLYSILERVSLSWKRDERDVCILVTKGAKAEIAPDHADVVAIASASARGSVAVAGMSRRSLG